MVRKEPKGNEDGGQKKALPGWMVPETVISQQLLPGRDGQLVPAYEIMHMTNAIRSMIRESKSHQIDNAIASGGGRGWSPWIIPSFASSRRERLPEKPPWSTPSTRSSSCGAWEICRIKYSGQKFP